MLKAKSRSSVQISGRGVKMKRYSAVNLCILFNCYSGLVQICSCSSNPGEIIEMSHVFSSNTKKHLFEGILC
ncbi:hypothetical protein PIB30_023542 [Stylosanthes scabra]|uniref:Uncharacterized protein n=1 Tax=Stylosanthes scabra TaxID=79078 RepID=A0ABU6V7N7_9FABA|nr:hypothetical protein [Stylosanthes scabra]